MSNVKELRNDLVNKVLDLGVGVDFLSHPAFIPTLSEISNLVGSMNILDPENVIVSESSDKILFEYSNSSGDKYNFELTASENNIKCIRVNEPHSFQGKDGVVRSKEAFEIFAELEGEEVVITTNYGSLNNVGCDNVHYNLISSINKCIYDKHGVMREKEYKYYDPRKGEGYFHRVGPNELLSFARWVPSYNVWNEGYSIKSLLRREYLDTAVLVYQDKDNNQAFNGVVPLNQEHGLRDMYVSNPYNTYPVPEVVIQPLEEEEIEKIISRESDERVAEGLRLYAQGRSSYSYNSNGDGQATSARVM